VAGFKVRRATAKDIDLLVAHRRAMFAEMGGPTPQVGDAATDPYRRWAARMMRRRLFHGYIVTSGGDAAASGCVWLRETQPSRGHPAELVPYIMSIYTAPEFRRKGLASMVVKEAMTWAKKNGYRKMTLHASDAGREVYSRLGWTQSREMEVRFEPVKRGATRRPSTRSKVSR